MKKAIAIFFVCMLFSCTAQKEVLPDEFYADVAINIKDKGYSATYEKRNEFDKLTFVSPENLRGLCMTLQNGVVTVKMGDTVFESQPLKAMFDFLPILKNETKTLGNREYTIYNIRGAE